MIGSSPRDKRQLVTPKRFSICSLITKPPLSRELFRRSGLSGRIHRILHNACGNPRPGLRWTIAAFGSA